LNTKKSIFVVLEGKLLGHIISKEGISTYTEKAKDIMHILFPNSKKSMQSFLRKINFVHIFFIDFFEIVKSLQHMIKKDAQFKWIVVEKEAFNTIITHPIF
jgi:hypothetical protein